MPVKKALKARKQYDIADPNFPFRINGPAVYPPYGLMRVGDIGNLDVAGWKVPAVHLIFESGGRSRAYAYIVPVNMIDKVGLRPVSSWETCLEMMEALEAKAGRMPKWIHFKDQYLDALKSGDLVRIAKAYKTLQSHSTKQKKTAPGEGGFSDEQLSLSFGGNEALEAMLSFLACELGHIVCEDTTRTAPPC